MACGQDAGIDARSASDIEHALGASERESIGQRMCKVVTAAVHGRGELARKRVFFHGAVPIEAALVAAPVAWFAGSKDIGELADDRAVLERGIVRRQIER